MRIRTTLGGASPLLLHNIQLANPDNEWTKQIAAITSKRKKTEDDRREIARLEWMGSLYVSDGQVVIPTGNVRRCFQESAKITRQGKQLNRALSAADGVIYTPLAFEGRKRSLAELVEDPNYRDVTLVGITGNRTVRVRPYFRTWGLEVEWELLSQVLDFDDFKTIAELAGKVEGLGDNRTNGFGRFDIEIQQVDE
jgi:hypothetical protein